MASNIVSQLEYENELEFNSKPSHPESFRNEDVYKITKAEIISRCGLDTYLFLRYLQILSKIFGPLAILVLPVLIPINFIRGIGTKGGMNGLDTISWSNVSPKHTARYWAHLCMALVVILWVCYIVGYEICSYTKVRHRRILSVERFKNACGTTVLVTDIPSSFLEESHLRTLYSVFPGGVKHIHITRDCRRLKKLIQERDQVVKLLEKTETQMMIRAFKNCRDGRTVHQLVSSNRIHSYLPLFQKPWLPSIPFFSQKVDLIDSYRVQLRDLNTRIREQQKDQSASSRCSSAVIRFNKPSGAFMASQSVLYTEPYTMTATLVEDPSHIIWDNISLNWFERYTRKWLLTGLSVLVICACVVPVAFTGLLSQLSYTASLFSWLRWVEHTPSWLLSVLQGVLPPAILAVTMGAAPLLLQYLILAQGRISRVDAELALQDYYFLFLFLQVFLVVSIASSLATVLSSLRYNFNSFATLLALNLPKAANYFLSYIILQALSVSAGALLQVGRLIGFSTAYILDHTPRDVWERLKKPQLKLGTFFPVYTNLAVITLIYAVVTPLILVLSVLAFVLFWVVQRYNVLHVATFNTDTGGLAYIKALFQLFLGLYCMEIYLIGLFFLVRDDKNRVACIGQGIIMVAALAATATYHIFLKQAYDPLIKNVPVVLSSGTFGNVPRGNYTSKVAYTWIRRLRTQARELYHMVHQFLDEDISPIADYEEAEKLAIENVVGEVQDEALAADQLPVWLPRDELGISTYEIERTLQVSTGILISDESFTIDGNGRIRCSKNPTDKRKSVKR